MRKLHWILIISCAVIAVTGIVLAVAKPEPGNINIHAISDLAPGGSAICSWDWGNLSGAVSVTLWQGSKQMATFANACPLGVKGKGSFAVKIPANLAPGSYEIHVKSLNNPKIEAIQFINIIGKADISGKPINNNELKYSSLHNNEHKAN